MTALQFPELSADATLLRRAVAACGDSIDVLADVMGRSDSDVKGWAAGTRRMPTVVQQWLIRFTRLAPSTQAGILLALRKPRHQGLTGQVRRPRP